MGTSGQNTESCTATRMKHDRISIDPKVMFGKPVIKGTRIPVEHILRRLAGGLPTSDVLAAYPHITEDDIRAALAFAADSVAFEEITVANDPVS